MSTHRTDPWAHDPEYCGTLDCPGCYAAVYVSRDQRTPAEFSVYLFNSGRMEDGAPIGDDDDLWEEDRVVNRDAYDNGDRCEDTERGIANDSGSAFYTDSGA